MNNNLSSLNNYLFEELERLNDDESLQEDKFDKELKRAKAISGIGMTIVNNAKVVLDARKYAMEIGEDDPNKVLQIKEMN